MVQSKVAYYNEDEINSLYETHISDKVEIKETETNTVTAKIVGIIGALTGSVQGKERNKTIQRVSDESMKKAVELTRKFIHEQEIPEIGNGSSQTGHYRYSGHVDAFVDQDNSDMLRIEGQSNGVDFTSYLSTDNWTSGSYIARAGSQDPQKMNIDGIAHETADSVDGREIFKFIIIYRGDGKFLIQD